VTDKPIQGRGLANLSLLFLFLLWLALFAWRKTFSYLNVGGIYVIELTGMLGLWLFALVVLLRPRLSFSVPSDARIQRALLFAGIFVVYNVARAALSPEINSKGLIPGIYPAYFAIALIIATNASEGVVRFVSRALVVTFFLTPAVMYLNSYVITPIFGAIEDPGATYIYGVTMMLALVLVKNHVASFLLFGIYFAFSVMMFERGTFVNAAVAGVVLLVASNRRQRRTLTRRLVFTGAIGVAVMLIATPIVLGLLFDLEKGRFVLTSGNLIKFFLSITGGGGELGLGGTRQHRLEMWAEIVRMVFSGPASMLFGFGYKGEVGDALGISFRAPHNGFLTILFRGGIIGLGLFLTFLYQVFMMLRRAIRTHGASEEARRAATVGLVVLGSLIGDSLTGTILDSPFTSWLFYMQAAVVCVLAYRVRDAAPSHVPAETNPPPARLQARPS
jgi:hypothetical protein